MFKILFNPQKAKKHPFETFFLGFLYSSFSILFALWIFPNYSSIAMIFLTVFSCLYLIQSATKIEEEKEVKSKSEKSILKEHSKLISLLFFLFLGFTIAFTFWSFILPAAKVSSIFSMQKSVVDGIRAAFATGSFSSSGNFLIILINNLKVLLTSLVFAFFYGAGAIYVLVWNASVMGFVIGNLAKSTFGITALPIAFTKYFLHGIPEMIAYLIIALAGGLLYVAFWKGHFKKPKKRKKIIIDVLTLTIIAIIILILAALIEVYISPLI
ncbi:MAG: stage II sporulation protein M [archaeon]